MLKRTYQLREHYKSKGKKYRRKKRQHIKAKLARDSTIGIKNQFKQIFVCGVLFPYEISL